MSRAQVLEIRVHPLPIHPDNQVRRASAVVAELLAFRATQKSGHLVARRLGRGRHEFETDEKRGFRRERHDPLAVRPSDQQFGKLFLIVPFTRHVPYSF